MARKNARNFLGDPLVAWPVGAARQARLAGHVICSTDSDEIAGLAREAGAEVPFMRPLALAADDSAILDVLVHAGLWFEETIEELELVCLLQPTCPLVEPRDVDSALRLAGNANADSVISGYVGDQMHPSLFFQRAAHEPTKVSWLTSSDTARVRRRQDLEPYFVRAGAVYVFRWANLRRGEQYGDEVHFVEVPAWRGISIDTEFDFVLAEAAGRWAGRDGK